MHKTPQMVFYTTYLFYTINMHKTPQMVLYTTYLFYTINMHKTPQRVFYDTSYNKYVYNTAKGVFTLYIYFIQ